MLLELRWADDSKAKAGSVDTLGPMLNVEFGDSYGISRSRAEDAGERVFTRGERTGIQLLLRVCQPGGQVHDDNGIEYHVSSGSIQGEPHSRDGSDLLQEVPVGGVPEMVAPRERAWAESRAQAESRSRRDHGRRRITEPVGSPVQAGSREPVESPAQRNRWCGCWRDRQRTQETIC